MALERVFDCPRTIGRFRSGPLGAIMDGFCADLLSQGFSRHRVRGHIGKLAHLNAYLGTRQMDGWPLSAEQIADFFRDYPAVARNRGPLALHLADVRYAINRLIAYLRPRGGYEDLADTKPYDQLLEAYRGWLRSERGCAPGTVELRTHCVRRFLDDLGPLALHCETWTADQVTDFFVRYAARYGPSARRQMQAGLRTLLRFCRQRGDISTALDRAVPVLRTYRLATIPRGFSDEQARAVLRCIDRGTLTGCRDYAMCLMLYTYGVRGGQVRALRLEDVDWAAERLTFHALKHGKASVLPLTQAVGSSLYQYLQQRPPSHYRRVFLTVRAPYKPLTRSTHLSTRVATYVDRAGLEGAPRGTHAFRHGFATRMLSEGHPLKSIADVLGHRHLDTTFLYTKVDIARLKQVPLHWPGGGEA